MIRTRPFFAFTYATTAAVSILAVAVPAARAADWSDWQAVPDHYAGKVSFRLQSAGKKGGYTYQLRNDYDQKVTVKFLLTGRDKDNGAQRDERSIVLEPGEQKLKSGDQTVDYASLTGATLLSIQFSAAPPARTLSGFYAPSIQIPALEKAIKSTGKQVEEADKDQKEADSDYAATRVAANSATGVSRRTSDSGEAVSAGGSIGEVQGAQSDARTAGERAQQLHARLTALKIQLTEMQTADAQAKTAGEKAFQAALAAPATANVTPIVTASGTTSPAVSNAVIATPGPPAAPSATTSVPSPTAKIATLTGDQMKSLYKTAGDAAKKKDWPTVETSLHALLEGSGDTIKTSDRADLYYRLGTAFDNDDNKAADADAAYSKAIELGIKDDALYNELATVQYSEGKLPEAEKSERLAIEKKSSDSNYFYNLGLICTAAQKYKDAETAFRSALRLDPDNDKIKQHIKAAQDAQKGGGQ